MLQHLRSKVMLLMSSLCGLSHAVLFSALPLKNNSNFFFCLLYIDAPQEAHQEFSGSMQANKKRRVLKKTSLSEQNTASLKNF